MSEDFVIRLLLLPFSILYGLTISLRNLLYRFRIVKSVKFSIPVISIGNLSVGGTGKTPHIEYLLIWLGQYLEVATLSRGYGRKTTGGREVLPTDTAETSGDEPLQFKRKFQHIPVFVHENRAYGIPLVLQQYPQTKCVLLDDAFQHRAVLPGKQILLTEYGRPYTRDWLLPAGRLREWRSGAQRADIIVVTKCPNNLTDEQKQAMIKEIEPLRHQKVFFSKFVYQDPYHLWDSSKRIKLSENLNVLLVTAIAHVAYLVDHLSQEVNLVRTLEFSDHHLFTDADIETIRRDLSLLPGTQKVIICTEKDGVKLDRFAPKLHQLGIDIYVIPTGVAFLGEDEAAFKAEVQGFLMGFQA
jgi:tetraacyldisaccharide 4'-kinase